MTDAHDPYRAPAARSLETDRAGRLRIEGKCLVAPLEYRFPEVCVKTGERVTEPGSRQTKKLAWSPAWVAILFLVNLLVMLIAYFMARKTTVISYAIKPHLHRDYVRRRWISIGAALGGPALIILGIVTDTGALAGVGSVAFLVGLILLATWARGLWAQRIDDRFVHVRGIPAHAMRAIIEATAQEEQAHGGDWRDLALAGMPRRETAGA